MFHVKMNQIHRLTECAILVALSFVLSLIKIPTFLFVNMGGSITALCMLPLVIISLRHGVRWGLLSGFVFSLIKLMMGLDNLTYCPNLSAQILCVLFDYLLAYTVLGLADIFCHSKKSAAWGAAKAAAIAVFGRFICSFISGIIVWNSYADALSGLSGIFSKASDWSQGLVVVLYSFIYNASYMFPEIIFTSIAAYFVGKYLLPRLKSEA